MRVNKCLNRLHLDIMFPYHLQYLLGDIRVDDMDNLHPSRFLSNLVDCRKSSCSCIIPPTPRLPHNWISQRDSPTNATQNGQWCSPGKGGNGIDGGPWWKRLGSECILPNQLISTGRWEPMSSSCLSVVPRRLSPCASVLPSDIASTVQDIPCPPFFLPELYRPPWNAHNQAKRDHKSAEN
ncbi:hypothetical protein BD309DRAFT_686546 [Dichomitus squalens]|nr:hypothetical protein BD309DRAFT_686546 [Dichomitus squalens]